MKRSHSLVTLVAISALLTGCAFEQTTSTTAPSDVPSGVPPAIGAPASGPSMLGTWSSNLLPATPGLSTCGNFLYQITGQTANSLSGTFTAVCGGLDISASVTGQLVGSNVQLSMSGTASLPSVQSCAFSLTGVGTIEDNGNTLRIPFVGTTCMGPVSGTEVLRRPRPQSPAPAPTPVPTPIPAPEPEPQAPPPPPPAPTFGDAIDLRQAVITAGGPMDVADRPITTKIDALDFRSDGVAVAFNKKDGPGRWPDVVPPGWDGPIQYTIWMVCKINGTWYTAGGVEYWYGLSYQGGPPSQFGMNWYYSPGVWGPLANYQPRVGEMVGFFITAGDQRVKDVRAVTERSNVVLVPFPSDNGAWYTF